MKPTSTTNDETLNTKFEEENEERLNKVYYRYYILILMILRITSIWISRFTNLITYSSILVFSNFNCYLKL